MGSVIEVKAKGRPVGSVDTPEVLIRRETKQHLGLMKKLRELVEEQVKTVGQQLEQDMGLTQRVEVVEKLADMLSIVGKSVESIGKLDKLASFTGPKEEESVSIEDVMKEFKGGR